MLSFPDEMSESGILHMSNAVHRWTGHRPGQIQVVGDRFQNGANFPIKTAKVTANWGGQGCSPIYQ